MLTIGRQHYQWSPLVTNIINGHHWSPALSLVTSGHQHYHWSYVDDCPMLEQELIGIKATWAFWLWIDLNRANQIELALHRVAAIPYTIIPYDNLISLARTWKLRRRIIDNPLQLPRLGRLEALLGSPTKDIEGMLRMSMKTPLLHCSAKKSSHWYK